jgi:hypothetical protein
MAQKNYTIYYKLTIIFEMDGDCNKGLVVGWGPSICREA